MTRPLCPVCAFVQVDHPEGAPDDAVIFICRRRAPVAIADPRGWPEETGWAVWPQVAETDWCGDFAPRPGARQ